MESPSKDYKHVSPACSVHWIQLFEKNGFSFWKNTYKYRKISSLCSLHARHISCIHYIMFNSDKNDMDLAWTSLCAWGHCHAETGKGLPQTQICPSDCQIVKRDSSLQKTRIHCSRVQWRRAIHHSRPLLALRKVILGSCLAARPWKQISWSSRRTVLVLMLFPEELSSECCSECCNWGQMIFMHLALQHSAVLFCELVWPITSRLSRCCS